MKEGQMLMQLMLLDLRPAIGLYIYALVTEAEYHSGAPWINKVYWSDHVATEPQGPRQGVQQAVDMWKVVMAGRDAIEAAKLGKVVQAPKNNILDLDAFRASRPRKHW